MKKLMLNRRLLKHGPAVGIGIGAGIAAAILFSLAGRATIFTAVLANLAPLPIMIAMLGYGLIAGASAVVSSTVTVAVLFYAQQRFGHVNAAALAGLTFALFLGLPALWLSLLSVLSRAKGSPNWVVTSRVGSYFAREYCPLERVLSYGASICAAIGVAIALYVTSLYGGFEVALQKLSADITPLVEQMMKPHMPLPAGVNIQDIAKKTILAAAPLAAGSSLVMLMLNLWLAARVTLLSGQLPRPWPNIAREFSLPQAFLLVFGVTALAGPYVRGISGYIMIIIAATIGVAFALVGLAVAHYFLRGTRFRVPLLTFIYLSLALVAPAVALILVLTGVIETAFSLRDRKDRAAQPKT